MYMVLKDILYFQQTEIALKSIQLILPVTFKVLVNGVYDAKISAENVAWLISWHKNISSLKRINTETTNKAGALSSNVIASGRIWFTIIENKN